jgi:hypothetical protein
VVFLIEANFAGTGLQTSSFLVISQKRSIFYREIQPINISFCISSPTTARINSGGDPEIYCMSNIGIPDIPLQEFRDDTLNIYAKIYSYERNKAGPE